jgi:hypothetical protein
MGQPQPEREDGRRRVVVLVVRSGGIAGRKRQWRAEPPADDAPRWIALIDECPWDAAPEADRGADRYVWRITVSTDGDTTEREARVPDSRLEGPWRTLVDEVRDTASAG